jgi:recombination protein RecT
VSTALALRPAELVRDNIDKIVRTIPAQNAIIQRRFRDAAIAVAGDQLLARCDPGSVLRCIAQCARLGLVPDPVLKLVYLVPFGGKAQIVLGYGGLIDLATRADPSLRVTPGVVYDNDDYILEEGLTTVFKIVKRHWQKGEEPGNPVFFYCVTQSRNAEPHLTIVPTTETDKLADKAREGSLWKTKDGYISMGLKTPIRRAAKLWVINPERADEAARLREAVALDEGEAPSIPDDFEGEEQAPAPVVPTGNTKVGAVRKAPAPTPPPQQTETAELSKQQLVSQIDTSVRQRLMGIGVENPNDDQIEKGWWVAMAKDGVDTLAAVSDATVEDMKNWLSRVKRSPDTSFKGI